MKETFIRKAFKGDSLKWIARIILICENYQRQGLRLSLRQVYYQLVAHHGLPNREQSYKNIGSLVTDARLAGLIDWSMIEDRNRETVENLHWDSPGEMVGYYSRQYRIDLWINQPVHVEVMVEKAALEGVIAPVCRRWDVPFTSNRGYSSSTSMYETGKRLQGFLEDGKCVVILYLGDHDPSGIDMTRDVEDRLALFSRVGRWVSDPEELESLGESKAKAVLWEETEERLRVDRLALNMDQIRHYNPPPNPAKQTDSRHAGYVNNHGDESWELDALEPTVLAGLVESAIRDNLDEELWDGAIAHQNEARARLKTAAAELEKEI